MFYNLNVGLGYGLGKGNGPDWVLFWVGWVFIYKRCKGGLVYM